MKIRAWFEKAAAKLAALWKIPANFFRRQWKKIATVIAGHGLYGILSWIYDNLLYIPGIAYFGLLWGGIIMTIGSLLICFGLLFYYRKKQVNWLGYDALDNLKERGIEYAEKLRGWGVKKTLFGIPAVLFFYFPLAVSIPFLWLADKIVWLWLDTDKISDLQNQIAGRLGEGKKIIITVVFFLPAMLFRFLMWCLRIGGDVIAFFVLCILEDPFITTAYLRHGVCDGLRKKDLAIFFASVLVSNGYWIARTYALIEVAKAAFRSIFR